MPTTSTDISADLSLNRDYFTAVFQAMDAAERAASFNNFARNTGSDDPSYVNLLRRCFNECKNDVLRHSCMHTDEALLCAVENLMGCGDVEGVRRTADLWLGNMQPNVRAVVKANKEVRKSPDDPALIKDRAVTASIAVHHGATVYQIATCTGSSFSEVNKWLSNDK